MSVERIEMQRKHVLWTRWLLIIATSYLLLFSADDPHDVIEKLIIAYIFSNMVAMLLPERFFIHPLFYYFVVPTDTIFVGTALYLSGAANTDFFLTFFLVVIIAAIGRRLSLVLVGAGAVTLLYAWMLYSTGQPLPALRLPFLIVVAIFVGYLVERQMQGTYRSERFMADQIEYERMQSKLKESETNFRRLAETLTAAIFIFRDEKLHYVNPAAERVTGYSRRELLAMDICSILSRESREEVEKKDVLGATLSDLPIHIEVQIQTKDGRDSWVDVSLNEVEFEGQPARIATVTDVTRRKEREKELRHTASHDSLTGLPNRQFLLEELERLIGKYRRGRGSLFAVLYLDLDRFKFVNDSLGHAVGDQLLVALSKRLENCLRPDDTAARIGGDEFVVVLRRIKSVDDAMRAAERVHQVLSTPFKLAGQDVVISASIGIAISSDGYQNAEEILGNADSAMYRAKAAGKSSPQSFNTATHSRATEMLQLERDLRQALDRKEFSLYYQPLVSLEYGEIIGFEALLRWHHPERGMISPTEFIPVAEESGAIISIGWWVLEEACRQVGRWQKLVPGKPLSISVNLSYRQFMQEDLVEQVEAVLKRTGTDPSRLKLEFTENVLLEESEATAVKLLLLKASGVQLLIDDFGTGYTLLSHLNRFPMDMLKIDRSFVMRIGPSGENSEIVELILTIARTMGVDVIAEGVETRDQWARLRSFGCRYGQGYLFSPPVSEEEAEGLLIAGIEVPAEAGAADLYRLDRTG